MLTLVQLDWPQEMDIVPPLIEKIRKLPMELHWFEVQFVREQVCSKCLKLCAISELYYQRGYS